MRGPEQNFWQSMKSHKPQVVWLQRIENEMAFGMPDVLACVRHKHQVWVELKDLKRPVRLTSCPFSRGDIRLAQVNWHLKAASYGMLSVVAARMDKDIILLPGRMAVNAHELSIHTLHELNLIVDWNEFWLRLIENSSIK